MLYLSSDEYFYLTQIGLIYFDHMEGDLGTKNGSESNINCQNGDLTIQSDSNTIHIIKPTNFYNNYLYSFIRRSGKIVCR